MCAFDPRGYGSPDKNADFMGDVGLGSSSGDKSNDDESCRLWDFMWDTPDVAGSNTDRGGGLTLVVAFTIVVASTDEGGAVASCMLVSSSASTFRLTGIVMDSRAGISPLPS